MNKGVTILICTYNGARRLPVTLRHIAAQQLPAGMGCELIVVDNASTDDTIATLTTEWQQYDTNVTLRILTETKAGLTYARHTGITHALYEYVVLCDDDNWLSPAYAQKAFTILEKDATIGIVGGHGHFVYETTAPDWLLACNLYAGGSQAERSGPVKDHFVYGAGAILRKAAYEDICQKGFTSALTDRQGQVLSSGGDYELCYVLALAGYRIWYEDSLRFDHFITANRLTLSYYLTYIEESSHCFSVLEPYKILLKTQHPSSLLFRWELLKSWGYHAKKMGALVMQQRLTRQSYPVRTVRRLQFLILRHRLQSYRQFNAMKQNFSAVVRLQKKLSCSN